MKRFWTTTAVIGLLAAPAGAFAQSGAPSGRLWLVASKSLRGAQKDERPARKSARASKAKAVKAIKTETPEPIKVKPGETLIAISRKTGVPVSELAKLNKLKAPYHVRIGSSIKLPPKPYYAVKSGDTLYSLARRFGVDAHDLAGENDMQLSDTLRSNQRLYLPGGAEDSEAVKPEPKPERKPEPRPEPKPARPAPAVEPEPYARPQPYTPPAYTPAAPRTPPPAPYTAAPTPYSAAPVAAPPITSAPVEVGAAPKATSAPIPAPEDEARAPAPEAAPPPPPISETQPLQDLRPPSHSRGGLFGLFGRNRERDRQEQLAAVPPPAPKPAAKPAQQSAFETAPERTAAPVQKPAPLTAARPAAPTASTGRLQIIPTSPPPAQSDVVTAGRGKFLWPAAGQVISGFGPKSDGQRNDGVNILAASGDPVRSAAAGEVVYAGNQVPSFGNLVLIKHPGGWVTAYAHLSNIEVKNRDQVSQGQQIGEVGQTGSVDRPQLHFEIRYAPTPRDKATPVDPTTLLPGR